MKAGDGFAVDTQALRDVSVQLEKIKTEVTAQPPRDLDCPPSSFGHNGLTNAASIFSERLRRAIDALVEDTAEIARRLNATADSYDQRDHDVRSVFERILDLDGDASGGSPDV
jgi:hypothetical protein